MSNGVILNDFEMTSNIQYKDTPLFDVEYVRNGTKL